MATYKTPGVYIEEITTLPPSIAPVATAVPAFIGYTELTADGDNPTGLINNPTRITSMLEFIEKFGGPELAEIDVAIVDNYDADGNLTSRTITPTLVSAGVFNLYYSMEMYFNNGGGPCYIVSVGTYSLAGVEPGALAPAAGLLGGLAALEKVDEPTLLLFPDAVSLADETTYGAIVQQALAQCAKLQDRFTISDLYNNGTPSAIDDFRGALGLSELKYGSVYHPFLKTTLNYQFDETQANSVTHTENNPPPGTTNFAGTIENLAPGQPGDNPSMYRQIRAAINSRIYVNVPPSAAVAGVYASVDRDRGVWKAPANVSLRSTIAPTINITHQDQENLNVDATSGKSINAIRTFAGKGTLVWGARTLAGNDNEWRYIPVRRLFIFVEESVKKATEFVVFEPNDKNTWIRVRAMIENFLTGLWRDGALAGAKPEEAFFVKVGLGETMTAVDILEGRMIVEIGMAAVRPAEFIILKFSHKLQES